MSGYLPETVRQEARAAAIELVLCKPHDMASLHKSLEHALVQEEKRPCASDPDGLMSHRRNAVRNAARQALPGEPDHRSDCRFFVTEDEQNEEPVTIDDWVRASTGWRDQDGFHLRPPVAA